MTHQTHWTTVAKDLRTGVVCTMFFTAERGQPRYFPRSKARNKVKVMRIWTHKGRRIRRDFKTIV